MEARSLRYLYLNFLFLTSQLSNDDLEALNRAFKHIVGNSEHNYHCTVDQAKNYVGEEHSKEVERYADLKTQMINIWEFSKMIIKLAKNEKMELPDYVNARNIKTIDSYVTVTKDEVQSSEEDLLSN
ncbi:uncharacterized protein LOC126837361 [Adelges cooleyi]|uniref:uncharacterized protein LOC126837361 n=1 Tax=Adelges cooleyi TaxID=133065 RepID=UPI00217F5864|nr:uncharacterized protein LOC126837361 [Adelges cooleyi]